jgi:Uma2 family endonuclease
LTLPPNNQIPKYTYQDYLTWSEAERKEILDGIAVTHAKPSRMDQKICGELFYQIHGFLEGKSCEIYMTPFSVRLPKGNEKEEDITTIVEPDLAVIYDMAKLDPKGCKGAPDMIIEIVSHDSLDSLKSGRFIKYNIYENAGVREYWIVEPREKLISVFRLNDQKRYEIPEIYAEDEMIRSKVIEGLAINLQRIFNY